MSTHSAPCGFFGAPQPEVSAVFFHIGPGAVEDSVPRCHDLSDPLQVCLDGPFRYIISMENDYDPSWGYYVDIMGILCGYRKYLVAHPT